MIPKQSFLTFHDRQEVQATLQSASTMHSQNKELQCYRGWKMQSQMQLGNSNSTAFWYLSSYMSTKPATERWASHLCLPALGCRSHSGACPCCAAAAQLSSPASKSGAEGQWSGSSVRLQLWPFSGQCRAGVPLPLEGSRQLNMGRCGKMGCHHRYDRRKKLTWRRNAHYLRNAVCLSNEQNQYCRGFIKFVFDENLCSDETVIPTGCFTIIFLTASKACVWRCMESKY